MVRILEARADENESGILYITNHLSYLTEDFKDIATSQSDVAQHLPYQTNENSELK